MSVAVAIAQVTRQWVVPEDVAGEPWAQNHPHPLVAEMLWRRGVMTPEAVADFLDPKPRPAPDVSALPNFAAAVARIVHAIREREGVAVFGDYDADGVTAAAILGTFLRDALPDRDRVAVTLPKRDEGYGLNEEAVRKFAGAHLLILVDTGSNDHQQVRFAQDDCAMDVVILDHHQIDHATGAPDGAITVSAYLELKAAPQSPLRDLTGAGLAWLMVTAVARELDDPRLIACAAGLQDLAALGTIADVASLAGINRSLVRDGLRQMRTRARPGVAVLCGQANVEPSTITARDVAMKIAPRLNAAGRMGDPQVALDLLTAPTMDAAAPLASDLEAINGERKTEMNRVQTEAEQWLVAQRGKPGGEGSDVLIAHSADWPAGVVGPAAAKLTERFGQPVMLLEDFPDGTSKGSARSVPGFDMIGALRQAARSVEIARFGGHTQAAGLTIATANIVQLAIELGAVYASTATTLDGMRPDMGPCFVLDADVPVDQLTRATAQALGKLGPFGQGNQEPLLFVRQVPVQARATFGRDPKRLHLKLFIKTPENPRTEVIVWGGGDRLREASAATHVDLAVRIGINNWNGGKRLELIAEDFRLAR